MQPEHLVREHAAEVFHLCLAMVRDRPVAEDLAQDAFLKAFAALPQLRGEARPWLLQIARNRCLDHLRRQQRGPWTDAPEIVQEGPADDSPLSAELLADRPRLARALAALPEQERAVVVLRFVHGFDYSEIASTFGIRSGAARMRVSRALARLRDQLEPRAALRARRSASPAPAAAPAPPFELAECEASPPSRPGFGEVLAGELRAPADLVARLVALSRRGPGA
jgi:RNA polymerase sigma-70 factor (ECF subfamily)